MSSEPQRRVMVVGAGAIGQTLAAALHTAGIDVSIISHRDDDAKRLQEKGVVIVSEGQMRNPVRIPVSSAPAMAADADILLACIKCYDTSSAMQALSPHLREGTPVVLIQNGAGAYDEAAAVYPRGDIYCGITSYGALLNADRSVTLFDTPSLTIVPCPGSSSSFSEPSKLLAGIAITVRSDSESVIWSKLCLNCGINPVTALFSIRNGEVPKHAEAWQLALDATREARTVADAVGIRLLFSHCEDALKRICDTTSGNRSSMLQDIDRGKRTEIDYMNGYVVKTAEKLGIAVPVNRQLIERLSL